MNKRNEEYFVLFGNDRYRPDDHYRACRDKFDYIKEARAYAKEYDNAYIFKAKFDSHSGDMLYVTEVD